MFSLLCAAVILGCYSVVGAANEAYTELSGSSFDRVLSVLYKFDTTVRCVETIINLKLVYILRTVQQVWVS